MKGLSEKALSREKIIEQQKAEISDLQSALKKLKSQSDILEKISALKEKMPMIRKNAERVGLIKAVLIIIS